MPVMPSRKVQMSRLDAALIVITEKDQRIAQLEAENGVLVVKDGLRVGKNWVENLMDENDRLREYYEAHMAIELGLADFDLHNDAVKRLEDARDALKTFPSEPE